MMADRRSFPGPILAEERVNLEAYGREGSGVTGFAIRDDFMVVRFKDRPEETYIYNDIKPGPAHLSEMKRRARAGAGLTTYINQQVGANYFAKLG